MVQFTELVSAVEREYEIPEGQLFAKTRRFPYPEARQMLMYVCKKHMHYSLVRLSQLCGITHATIIYAVRKTTTWLEYYEETQYHYSQVLSALGISNPLEKTSIH